jgi:lysozyme
MRPRSMLSFIFSAFLFSGCSISSGLEGIEPPTPSLETTNSIVPDRPVPPEPTDAPGGAGTATMVPPPAQQFLAVPDKPKAFSEVAKPRARNPFADRKIHARRFGDAKPINFGKQSPRHLPVHGVDVSRWQGDIDWPRLRAHGANFAYIKATDGGDHLDPMFKKNWRAADEAGLRRGAYHFFYWCRTGGEQADWFIRNVPKVANALPPVIDVEWNGESRCRKRPSRERVLEKMQVFMDKLEAHYGQRPVIYTAPDFYEDNLQGAFPNHHFWLRAVAQHPRKVYPGRKWVFWQYSGSGLSKGVSGRIDLNVFNGSEGDWHDWLDRHAG